MGMAITNVHVCAIILTNCANIRTQLIKPDPHDLRQRQWQPVTAHVRQRVFPKTKLLRQERGTTDTRQHNSNSNSESEDRIQEVKCRRALLGVSSRAGTVGQGARSEVSILAGLSYTKIPILKSLFKRLLIYSQIKQY